MPYKSFRLSDIYSNPTPPTIRKESCKEPVVRCKSRPSVSVYTSEIISGEYDLFARKLVIKISYSVFHDLLGWTMKDRFTFKVQDFPFDEAQMRIQKARSDSAYKLRPTVQKGKTVMRLSVVSGKLSGLIPQMSHQRLSFRVSDHGLVFWLPVWLAE